MQTLPAADRLSFPNGPLDFHHKLLPSFVFTFGQAEENSLDDQHLRAESKLHSQNPRAAVRRVTARGSAIGDTSGSSCLFTLFFCIILCLFVFVTTTHY